MSKYNSEKYKEWYYMNKDRIKPLKKAAKKKYRRSEAGRAAQRRYNHKPSRMLYVRNFRFKQRYGITLDQYEVMMSERNNLCDICSIYDLKLHVDHDHLTGEIRGLLCGTCNRALGLFKDNKNILLKAIDYLK